MVVGKSRGQGGARGGGGMGKREGVRGWAGGGVGEWGCAKLKGQVRR